MALSNVDPAISLGITAPSMGAAANPLGMLGQFASIQNALNQNRLFQQTFAARQRAGQIIAGAPDPETGIQNLWSDPQTAAFAGPIAQQYKDYQLAIANIGRTVAETGKIQSETSGSIMHNTMQLMGAVYQNPAMWGPISQQALANAPPELRSRVATQLDSLRISMLQGVDPKSPDWQAQLGKNISGILIGSGVTPDAVRALGGQVAPGVQTLPTTAGGEAPVMVGGPLLQGNRVAPIGAGGIGSTGTAPTGVQGGTPVSPTGAPVNALGGAAAGRAGMIGPTPGITQKAEMEATGKAGGDINQDMIADAQELPNMIRRLDMMQGALTQFQAGGGAEARGKVAQVFQALGASDKIVNDIGNQSLPATQVFTAEVKPFVINLLKQNAVGTGRVMRSEVDTFLGMLNAATDPQAIMAILNQARYALQIGYDKSQKFVGYKQALQSGDPSMKGLDMADFPMWYNKQFRPQLLPAATPGGLQLGPVSNKGVLGIPSVAPKGAPKGNALGGGQTLNPSDFGIH